MRDLYQINPDTSWDYAIYIETGVLVKVEPDYDAAERAFRLDRDEPFGNLISDRLRRAIDAAFVRLDEWEQVEPALSPDQRASLMYACQRIRAGNERGHDWQHVVSGMEQMLEWMKRLDDEGVTHP